MITVSFDPSLTGWGYAVFHNDMLVDYGIVSTKKGKGRVAFDLVNRAFYIVDRLLPIIQSSDVIVSELPHGSQSSAAAVMIGMVIGISTALSRASAKPIYFYLQRDWSIFIHGKHISDKNETVKKILQLYEIKGSKRKVEAVADAVSVFLYHRARMPK